MIFIGGRGSLLRLLAAFSRAPFTVTMNSTVGPQQRPWKTLWIAIAAIVAVGLLWYGFGTPRTLAVSATEAKIFNATLGFGGIYAVSLPSRTDRRDSLTVAAANTDLHIDFVDGLQGDQVADHALPADANRANLGAGNIGSWRAHMNAIQHIVANNISSALIMEDDLDWDVRIKPQLADFAKGVRALTQPLSASGGYIDPTLETRAAADQVKPLNYDLTPQSAPSTTNPIKSPYGDNWDVLWLGHCGVRFPAPGQTIPKGRYVISNDETVPSFKHRTTLHDELRHQYEDHTRVVHHAMGPICSFAYAVSQRGARRILQEIGIQSFTGPYDNVMAAFCDRHTCITSQPQYFNHWRAAGSGDRDSEINGFGNGQFREQGFSENIRMSVRQNTHRILDGATTLQDQFPD